jgi:hypothetical protein
MGKKSKREYLERIRARYRKALKLAKGVILDEFCEVCGFHRKYAIRLLNQKTKPPARKPGRPSIYPTILLALKRIWFASDQMCSKKLKAALPHWLPFYDAEFEPLPEPLKAKLTHISAATIDRLLKPVRASAPQRGLSGTRPGTLLKNQIPLHTDHWDVTRPGFLEADSVAHCGNSLAGNFVWSLTLTDIATGWTENRATWNKGATGVLAQIRDVEAKLPFLILGFDCDNGSEFLNYHLLRYFTHGRKQKIQFTRSRPYRKDDNAHVEQKNWTHVRQLLGYQRFDQPRLVNLLNTLYTEAWCPYQNFFCPTQKLLSKQRINAKYVKRYESPKTPFQRLLESDQISRKTKQQLMATYQTLNPFTLKRQIEQHLKEIFAALRSY